MLNGAYNYRCIYIYIYIYIQTLLNPQLPTPFLSFFLFALHGRLTQRGGSYDGFFLVWTLGNLKWQNARAARVPISGPSHPYSAFSLRKWTLISGLHTHPAFSLSQIRTRFRT